MSFRIVLLLASASSAALAQASFAGENDRPLLLLAQAESVLPLGDGTAVEQEAAAAEAARVAEEEAARLAQEAAAAAEQEAAAQAAAEQEAAAAEAARVAEEEAA
ncbi:hypothetical protein VQ042_25455, partial [Aurantimonas sp. A2-1-M11]|uniref:hypothetical protein n=1 Tax=Aurantimonas sp. A2-1-M11 TaxID=3113712 RepID=UPI002F93A1A3